MTLNSLPNSLQAAVQQGFLEHRFETALRARLGFRGLADREPFMANLGETITKTRPGLLAQVTAPMATASNTDITSGLTPQNLAIEQYTLTINQYANTMNLNLATSQVAIVDMFLQNADKLGENGARSVDGLAANTIFGAYLGGNTRVRTTLGSPGPTISVDDIRGFQQFLTLFPGMLVEVGAAAYTLSSVAADGSNVSTSPNGISGTLTFTGNVTTGNGTAGMAVVAAVAPSILRPNARATTAALAAGDTLTINTILNAKAQLEANNVPTLANGWYQCFADPIQISGLYSDPVFQQFFRGRPDTEEYKRGAIAELLGVEIVKTNMSPVQALNGLTVRRAIVAGQGALVEGVFTATAYAAAESVDEDAMITMVDDIAHVIREPIDVLKQVINQSWSYIGGFVAPTDTTVNPSTLPTASNAALKRAVVIESL